MREPHLFRAIDTATEEHIRRLRATRDRIRRNDYLDLEDPRRVMARARRLADEPDGVGDLQAAERVIGKSNEMVHAHFLARGARAAAAVARIVRLSKRDEIMTFEGTGSLIAPRLLITNHHVLSSATDADRCGAEFGFEYDVAGRIATPALYRLDPGAFFHTNERLDVSVVGVAAQGGEPPGERFGQNPLDAEPGRLILGDYVNIVQHPGGRLKQVAFRENRVIEENEEFLAYETDTEPGSSGSPVFNDQWALVAIHRQSLARVDDHGQVLMKDGTRWRDGLPDHEVDWYANEGAKASAVAAWLGGATLTPEQQAMLEESVHG